MSWSVPVNRSLSCAPDSLSDPPLPKPSLLSPYYKGMTSSSFSNTEVDDPIVLGDASIISEMVEFDFEQGSVVAGSGDADTSLVSPAPAPDPSYLTSLCNTGRSCQNPDNSDSTEKSQEGGVC